MTRMCFIYQEMCKELLQINQKYKSIKNNTNEYSNITFYVTKANQQSFSIDNLCDYKMYLLCLKMILNY